MTEEKTYTLKDVEAERAHAQKFEGEVLELKKKLKAFEGFDPADYAKTKAERDELKNKAAAGSPEEVAARVKEAVEAEKARLEGVIAKEREEKDALSRSLKTERATKQILQKAAGAFGQDTLELLTPIFDRDSDFEDGQIIFKDAKGNKRYSPKDGTKLMSIDEYIDEIRAKYPSAATATAGSGSKDNTKKISGSVNGIEIKSLRDAAQLPDRGAEYFKELAKTPEGEKKLDQIMSNRN